MFNLVVARWTASRWVPGSIPDAGQDTLGFMLDCCFVRCHKCMSPHWLKHCVGPHFYYAQVCSCESDVKPLIDLSSISIWGPVVLLQEVVDQ